RMSTRLGSASTLKTSATISARSLVMAGAAAGEWAQAAVSVAGPGDDARAAVPIGDSAGEADAAAAAGDFAGEPGATAAAGDSAGESGATVRVAVCVAVMFVPPSGVSAPAS
ncbi:MAG: hypothetical protein ACYC8U_15935, partial [Thermoleophilia bacterium]